MRWLVATALFAAGCDSLFNLDHLKAPLIDSGSQEIDATEKPADGPLVDASTGKIDAPDASTDNGQCAISYAGNRYQVKNALYTWAMADSYCRTLQVPNSPKYSHLAVVDDQTDLALIASTAGATAAWVGLAQDADQTWRWVTAETIAAILWAPGEPTGAGACATVSSGGLADTSCAEAHAFVCECDDYPPP